MAIDSVGLCVRPGRHTLYNSNSRQMSNAVWHCMPTYQVGVGDYRIMPDHVLSGIADVQFD